MPSNSERSSLPFEPRQKRKKASNQVPAPSSVTSAQSNRKSEASLSAIPAVVSQRMGRRMAYFSGIPTALGVLTFISSYWIVTHEWFKLPTIAVLFVSMGFFGLGVAGLTYGILSASWDEDRVGSWWGTEEFTTNFGRMVSAWRSAREN